ncbi:MAG: hydratase, partial [Burkholderiaceae bacterium]
MLSSESVMAAAEKLHNCWRAGEVLDALGTDLHPIEPADGYAIQAAGAQLRGESVIGWKIAATSQAGRDHINVDRPLAGRMFESAVFQSGATVSLAGTRMMVAEAEFVFVMGASLYPRADPFTEDEVSEAIGRLHPGL